MTYPQQPGDQDPYGQTPGYPQQQGYPGYGPQPGFYVPSVAEPGPRPKVVTFAAMVIVMTVLGNVGVGLMMGFGMAMPDSVEEVDRGGAIATGAASIVIGIGFIAVALGVLRGRAGARTAAFVMYAISGCCGGIFTLGAAGYAFDPAENAGAVGVFLLSLTVVAFLAYVTVILLLALPVSGQWFREHTHARRAGIIS